MDSLAGTPVKSIMLDLVSQVTKVNRGTISFALICLGTCGLPCCTVSDGNGVSLSSESALIVWNPESKTESFTRQASFDTKAASFGFIVPTPTVPKVEVAELEVLQKFQAFAEKKARETPTLACAAPADKATGLAVLSDQMLGDYRSTVIKATDGSSMADWMKRHNFLTRPAMVPWLDHYAKMGWAFTALRYTGDPDGESRTKALRFTFQTERPFYPWKMPADTSFRNGVRDLSLSIVSSTPMRGVLSNSKSWNVHQLWSGDASSLRLQALRNQPQLSSFKSIYLTSYKNDVPLDNFEDDLFFEPVIETPSTVLVVATSIGVLGSVLLFRKMRSSLHQSKRRPG